MSEGIAMCHDRFHRVNVTDCLCFNPDFIVLCILSGSFIMFRRFRVL